MRPRPIVNDALWRCLCPSFAQPEAAYRSIPIRQARPALRNRQCSSQYRSIFSTARARYHDASSGPRPHSEPRRPFNRAAKEGDRALALLPTNELYERLRSVAAAGRNEEVFDIIKILLKDRRERPNIRLYASLLHSFASAQGGTAGKIRKTLEEMAEEGVDLDSGACHFVLEALAVHPDYLLRDEMLAYMKERWFTLTDRGHNMVVAGLLRDRLFEQAVEKIEEMGNQQIKVADWLLDKAIYILLDYREIDEAWQLMVVRQQEGRTAISPVLWSHFLDMAGTLCHIESATSIWISRVVPGYLKPSSGTCLHVLNLAGRSGNVQLATDVFRVLADRNATITSHHYETLLESYLHANDLHAALSVALIMHESGMKVNEAAINPLYTYLKADASRPMAAFTMLQDAEAGGRKVPTACVNACMQAAIQLERFEEAVEFYKVLHSVSRAGPNTQTFNILFQGCHQGRPKDLAMFLAAEMVKLGVKPDALTYDRLVLVCCLSDDLEDAFLYYEEMRREGFVPRKGTFEKLIEVGVREGDGRAVRVLSDLRGFHTPSRDAVAGVMDRFEGGGAERRSVQFLEHKREMGGRAGAAATDSVRIEQVVEVKSADAGAGPVPGKAKRKNRKKKAGVQDDASQIAFLESAGLRGVVAGDNSA